MKLIAQHLNVSRYTVQCQLIKAGQTLSPKTWDLPEHLGIDEFKSAQTGDEWDELYSYGCL